MMKFKATVRLDGKTATGIQVPHEIVAALGGGNRPSVRVTFRGYSYQTTVARMRGQFLFPVSAAVREQAGVAAGDRLEVTIELDDKPRELDLPTDLVKALARDRGAKKAFEKLSHSNKKRHVLAIEGAKTSATRQRRLAKALDELRSA